MPQLFESLFISYAPVLSFHYLCSPKLELHQYIHVILVLGKPALDLVTAMHLLTLVHPNILLKSDLFFSMILLSIVYMMYVFANDLQDRLTKK